MSFLYLCPHGILGEFHVFVKVYIVFREPESCGEHVKQIHSVCDTPELWCFR